MRLKIATPIQLQFQSIKGENLETELLGSQELPKQRLYPAQKNGK